MIATFLILLILISASPTVHAQSIPPSNRTHWNAGRGYAPFRYASTDGIEIHNRGWAPVSDGITFSSPLSLFSLTFRASNISANPSKRFIYTDIKGFNRHRHNPEWSFWLLTSSSDSIIFTVRTVDIPDPVSSTTAVNVIATDSKTRRTLASATLKDGIDCFSGANTWKISATPQLISLSAGNRILLHAFNIPSTTDSISGFGFTASPAACIRISDITFADESQKSFTPHQAWSDNEKLSQHLSESKDPLEGYWTIFDRTLEESLLLLGGDYRFAIVKENDCYLVIYLSGARTNAAAWKPGMIKARLTSDPFPDTYSVIWYDVEGNPLSKDIKAQSGEGSTLTIQFPYQSSILRLRRISPSI